jgi:hypothetical protein
MELFKPFGEISQVRIVILLRSQSASLPTLTVALFSAVGEITLYNPAYMMRVSDRDIRFPSGEELRTSGNILLESPSELSFCYASYSNVR